MESLTKFWNAWKRFGQMIGDFIARVILTIFYFTIFAPFGIGVRLFGDPLQVRGPLKRNWVERAKRESSMNEARRLS